MEAKMNDPQVAVDHWQEFRALRRRMDERWPVASQLERGVLAWEVAEANRQAMEHEKRKAGVRHVEQAAP